MGKPTGFIEYKRVEAQHRPIDERIKDYAEFNLPPVADEIHRQAARCMDCGVSFCHAGIIVEGGSIGCPLGNLIPEINDMVYHGDIESAYERLSLTHPFPEFTARVCPALCEGSCTLGEHKPAVTVKNIERYVIDSMLENGKIRPRYPRRRTGKRVAVVGSGPAGLACADLLNQLGNSVTVYERSDRPGGLLMYGIPNMKLNKDVVMNRVRVMEDESVEFVLGREIGRDIHVFELMKEYDAIVLCGGSTQERKLTTPGSDLDGVYTAVQYLTATTKSLLDSELRDKKYISAEGKNVVIIGGGDTGTDCAATAVRQGAKSVVQLEILPCLPDTRAADNPWPLWPKVRKTDYGQLEAEKIYGSDPRQYLTTVKTVNGSKGKVVSITTVEVEWIAENGKFFPKETPGSEKTIPADLVLTAMGFIGPEKTLIEQLQLDVDCRGNVLAEYDGYETSLHTVFAAGDMRRGPSLVVWAIHEGREAARACDKFLSRPR